MSKHNYSKSKGSGYERVVAGLFDKWYGVPPKTFWRSRVSGAWLEPGDVISRDKSITGPFPFVVECKFQKGLNLWHLVNNQKSNWFEKFWKQLDDELKEDGKDAYGLLVFRTNRSPNYVSFDVQQFGGVVENCLMIGVGKTNTPKAIALWSTFVKHFKPSMFKGENANAASTGSIQSPLAGPA